jgi:hypothetical protein
LLIFGFPFIFLVDQEQQFFFMVQGAITTYGSFINITSPNKC